MKKNMKRNLMVIGSVLLIGGAVWLNWALFSNAGGEDYDPSYYTSGEVTQGAQKEENVDGTVSDMDSYFAMAAIDRSRARDEAMEVLSQITASTDATEEAKAEGFMELAARFAMVAAIEKRHEERYRKLAANLESGEVWVRVGENRWECRNCGHIYIGEKAPEICPVCSHPKAYFELEAKNY